MLRIAAIAIACVFCTVGAAFADIEIWAGGDITPPPTINHDFNTIEIEAAGTYGFRAWDGVDTLEEIQSITVDSGVTGDVTVTIAWDENGGNGAADLWTGNLTHATYAVDLAGLEISGGIATTDDFICDNITGTVDIDGDVVGEVTTTS